MASFDIETFLKLQGQTGTGVFESLGMSFGLPSCMLNLAKQAMELLPSSVLSDVQSKVTDSQSKASEVSKEVYKKSMLSTGIVEFDTEKGVFIYESDTSELGMDNDDKQTKDNLEGFLDAVDNIGDTAGDLYTNTMDSLDDLQEIQDCLGGYLTKLQFQSGNSADMKQKLSPEDSEALLQSTYAADMAKLENTKAFIVKCNDTITDINSILSARRDDPSLEPKFSDAGEWDPFLNKTNFPRFSQSDPGLEDGKKVFRLTYGPPASLEGQYVLTKDGLYYDSQTGGLDPIFLAISGIVPVGDKWKYNYDPNLGGKGQAISIHSLNKFTDNMFDPDRIDDSNGIQHYYDNDHFLSVLKQQRDKLVFDLSSRLTEHISEFGENSSIVTNHRQLIISEIANHNSKINRRKKQIELAVKAPQVYGGETAPTFTPGNVPINDFSYLSDYNLEVDLEKQKALVFYQSEVEGIVLPYEPKFVHSSNKPRSMSINHLTVPTVGKGSIIYSPSSIDSGTVLSLTDSIVSKGLFAIYNFLESKTSLPDSDDYLTTNCATEDTYNNAKMLSPSPNPVFVSGLGIPYFEGITKNKSSDPKAASGIGSVLRLPNTSEFTDLTYNYEGFTMECWVYVPGIVDSSNWGRDDVSSLTKVLLGCENVGVKTGTLAVDRLGDLRDLDFLSNDRGDSFVRGMLCGFTRDRRITQENTGYSNSDGDNLPASSLSFFIAPTQSRDASAASFINNDECEDFETFYKMKVDLSATPFGEVSSQFVLVDVTVSPKKNTIEFFADGNLITTSSISNVFGVDPYTTIALPSFHKENSFEYSSTTVDGPSELQKGPLLNKFYTPWIVGGGFTDGMYKTGNFLGGDRGGLLSGLRGHVGSLKFYSRPLNTTEVLQNYKAQEGFFKNIKI